MERMRLGGGYLPAFPSQTNQAQHRAEGIEAPSPNHAHHLTEVVTREKERERERERENTGERNSAGARERDVGRERR